MKRHTFDGAQLTLPEILERVSVLSETTVRRYLAAGRHTTQAMLSYDPRQGYSRTGKKSAKAHRSWGYA